MKAYQIFARMDAAQSVEFMGVMKDKAPGAFAQALQAASAVMKARPVYLKRQPFERRAEAVRRCLSRVAGNALAEELLATYFLDCRKSLLTEWLDILGLEHEDGILQADNPECPPAEKLSAAIATLRGKDDPDVELLLQAFAAQSAIDWPELDQQLEVSAA